LERGTRWVGKAEKAPGEDRGWGGLLVRKLIIHRRQGGFKKGKTEKLAGVEGYFRLESKRG